MNFIDNIYQFIMHLVKSIKSIVSFAKGEETTEGKLVDKREN